MSRSHSDWQAPPTWVLDQIVSPILELGIASGHIDARHDLEPGELADRLRRCLTAGLKLIHEGMAINFDTLAREASLSQAQLKTLLGKVEDWNWLIDNIRLCETDRGRLELDESTIVLKGDPFPHKGASIFASASRSIPRKVMGGLREEGLAPVGNPSAHATVTDCSAWLVEVAREFTLVMRVEPLPENTWFDPKRYGRELGARQQVVAEQILNQTHGLYETSTRRIVATEMIGSFLDSVSRRRGSAAGLTFESGCLPQGIWGRREVFVGSRLEQALSIERHKARAFFDLARLSPDDPKARRRADRKPWSGRLSIGEEDCIFKSDPDPRLRHNWEMAWAAGSALGIAEGRADLNGIFRKANLRAIQEAGADPDRVNYAVAQTQVRKADSQTAPWRDVGLLVGSKEGMAPSGFSVPFGDIRSPGVQAEAIAMAEAHLQRVSADGPFFDTLSRLRGEGIQGGQSRLRTHIQMLHGLILCCDILDVRSRLYM